MEQKPENNHTKRVRRRFPWPASSHLLSTKRKLPGPTALPTMEKGEEVSHQLPQPFGTYAQRICFGFTLPETGITENLEIARKKEGQRPPVSAMWLEQLWSSESFSAEDPSFHH